jgi:hypothetical protein
MKAIVILYDGVTPVMGAVKELIENAPFITNHSDVDVKFFDEDSIAGLVAKTCVIPTMSVEDGNASVEVIATLCSTKTSLRFMTDLAKRFVDAEDDRNSDATKGFLRACSILSKSDKDAPVSRAVAQKYGFTQKHRDIVRTFYKDYLNQ